jgi:ubiquinone/menaquinone biosynthesis C-methylase UbiE
MSWHVLHSNYQMQEWIEKPSLFAETAIHYFPKTGKVLELGAGNGQDSFYFAKEGYDVTTSDIETSFLEMNLLKQPESIQEKIVLEQLDLNNPLPFENESFDVIYAHLSLHYFDLETTKRIISEIERVLKPKGVFAFLTISIQDPEYNTGTQLEEDYFQVGVVSKRYFSQDSVRRLTEDFQIILLDSSGETYKDRAKDVTQLIRFIGFK